MREVPITMKLSQRGNLLSWPVRNDRTARSFALLVVAVFVANLVMNTVNHHLYFSDFKVYYMAAKDLLSGGGVYMQAFGEDSGFYKYSPSVLFFFLPVSMLPFTVAGIIHMLIQSFCYGFAFMIARNLVRRFFHPEPVRREFLLLLAAVVCTTVHMVKELYLGNININLVLLCMLALADRLEERPYRSGIWFGIVLLAKPFFFVLLIPMLLRKDWKVLLGIITSAGAGLLLPFLWPGPSQSVALYGDWYRTLMMHGNSFPGLHSIDCILRNDLFPGLPAWSVYIVVILFTGITAAWILRNRNREKSAGDMNTAAKNRILEWFVILAMIPSLFRTDSEHFLCALPLITWMIYSMNSRKMYWAIPLFVIAAFLYGGNATDLLGHPLTDILFNTGMTGVGNLLLVGLALWLELKSRQSTVHSQQSAIIF
jgi:hypothetical protein